MKGLLGSLLFGSMLAQSAGGTTFGRGVGKSMDWGVRSTASAPRMHPRNPDFDYGKRYVRRKMAEKSRRMNRKN
jgi:hypothetical protein